MSTSKKSSKPSAAEFEVGVKGGFWARVFGDSHTVITILAVSGVIVLAICALRLAEHAIEKSSSPPANTPAPTR